MNDTSTKVRISDLKKTYPNGDGVEHIDLDVHEGEILTMLGPSGCGKSTILRTIAGFERADSGSIIIDGRDVTNLPPEKRPTGMVFQSYNLWPHMTVEENLAFGLKLRKVGKKQISSDIDGVLDMIKMPGVQKKYPSQLSGGQQQRIAIARTLLLKPSVMLLDEPFSALDAKIRMQMREELRKLQSRLNITVIFVTHDQEEAMSISHRIVVMRKGAFEQIGTPSEIYDSPATKYVAGFIGEMNMIERQGETIAVRPEDIAIGPDEPFGGRVVGVMNMGHYNQVLISSTEHGDLKAFLRKDDFADLHEGGDIRYRFMKARTYAHAA